MSAPDVERLVEALTKCAETFERYTKLHLSKKPLTDEAQCKAIANHQMAEMCRNALSSHPDPLPASADIAGRLATALEEVLPLAAIGKLSDTYQNALEALAAYRANPSGWIPVGEGDTARIDALEKLLLNCPHTVIHHCDDPDEESPLGWSITTEGCQTIQLVAPTFREVIDKEIAFSEPRFYPAEELKKWWPTVCEKCGWRGLSRDAEGGHSLGMTGDYDDVTCPECHEVVEEDINLTDLQPPPQDEHSGRIYTAPEEIEAAQRQMREGQV